MTRGDRVRLLMAGTASLVAMFWLAMKEEYIGVAVVVAISATAGFLTRRKW